MHPFLIYSLFTNEKLDLDGINTSKFGETITFRFIDKPHTKYLNQLKKQMFPKREILNATKRRNIF